MTSNRLDFFVSLIAFKKAFERKERQGFAKNKKKFFISGVPLRKLRVTLRYFLFN
jgi:hypothetical protein